MYRYFAFVSPEANYYPLGMSLRRRE